MTLALIHTVCTASCEVMDARGVEEGNRKGVVEDKKELERFVLEYDDRLMMKKGGGGGGEEENSQLTAAHASTTTARKCKCIIANKDGMSVALSAYRQMLHNAWQRCRVRCSSSHNCRTLKSSSFRKGVNPNLKPCGLTHTCQRLRKMTRRAGRLTPAASVDVAVSTSSAPDLKPASTVCLSSVVKPA